jgi:DNA-binding transcriptional regulator YdaS (Cro superfamily)
MDLKDYFLPLDSEARQDFASRCKTTVKQLQNICTNGRVCSPELAINIERESGGKVPVERMAPIAKRIRVDWAYIRGTRRAKRTQHAVGG